MSNEADEKQDHTWVKGEYGKFICCQCHGPLYPPYQLRCCGERVCGICIGFFKDIEQTCPCCSASKLDFAPDQGYKREVDKEEIHCFVCGSIWKGFLKDLPEHLKTHSTQKCSSCKEEFINKIQLKLHNQYRCSYRTLSCPLADYGCSNEIPYSEITEHHLSDEHQYTLVSCIKQQCLNLDDSSENLAVQNRFKEQKQQTLEEFKQRTEAVTQEIQPIETDCTNLNSTNQIMETRCMEIREGSKKLNESHINIFKITESVYQLLNEMEQLIKNIQEKTSTSAHRLDNNDIYVLKIALMVLLNMNSAPIHSDPIESAQFGYRLGFSVTSWTNEYDKNGYIQISFTIYRGDYDAILSWPFPYSVTISLMDLSGGSNHIYHSIHPNSQSGIFDRPKSSTNPSYEIPQFCTVATLVEDNSQYVRDGNIFLQLHVDFDEKKSVLYESNNYDQFKQLDTKEMS